ncbi:hypothetical protein RUND412_000354 [Rhizina undulata]
MSACQPGADRTGVPAMNADHDNDEYFQSSDSISETSTVRSDRYAAGTYVVECILAEQYCWETGVVKFLVKWEGYDIEDCSWETYASFDSPIMIREWRVKTDKNFDLGAWNDMYLERDERRRERIERRARKRLEIERRANETTGVGSEEDGLSEEGIVTQQKRMKPIENYEKSNRSNPTRRENVYARRRQDIKRTGERPRKSGPKVIFGRGRVKATVRPRGSMAPSAVYFEDSDDTSSSSKDEPLERREKEAASRTAVSKNDEFKKNAPQKRVAELGNLRKAVGVQRPGEVKSSKRPIQDVSKGASSKDVIATGAAKNLGKHNMDKSQITSKHKENVDGRHRIVRKPEATEEDSFEDSDEPLAKRISISRRLSRIPSSTPEPDSPPLRAQYKEKDLATSTPGKQVKSPPASTVARNKEKVSGPVLREPPIMGASKAAANAIQPRVPVTSKPAIPNFKIPKRGQATQPLNEPTATAQAPKALNAAKAQPVKALTAAKATHNAIPKPAPPVNRVKAAQKEQSHNVFSDEDYFDLEDDTPAIRDGELAPQSGGVVAPGFSSILERIEVRARLPHRMPNPENLSFDCNVELGPHKEPMGIVRFTGFSPKFVAMVKDCRIESLWIAQLLEDTYLATYFVEDLGPPEEFANVHFREGQEQPLIDTLTKYHGAGVVIHEDFTLLIFLSSNEHLRTAFKPPAQHTIKTPLRVVAYPPLDVEIPTPSNVVSKIPEAGPIQTEPFYIHELLQRFLGVDYRKTVVENQPNYVMYSPEIAFAEQQEAKAAMALLGKVPLRPEYVPRLIGKLVRGTKFKISVLIHRAFRRQLHILPKIKILKSKEHPGVKFFFFRTEFDRHIDYPKFESGLEQTWSFGTVILVTAQLAITNPKAIDCIIDYQRHKSSSTTLCVPEGFLENVEGYVTSYMGNENGNEVLRALYRLTDKLQSNELIEIPLGNTDKHNSTNPVRPLRATLDRFLRFQLENCAKHRRFVICYAAEEYTGAGKSGLYDIIEFLDAEAVLVEFQNPEREGKAPSEIDIGPHRTFQLGGVNHKSAKRNEILRALYLLCDKEKKKELMELPLGNTVKYDRFLCFQRNHCAEYRRFVICHATDEDTGAGKSEMYDIIEFLDPEATLAEFQVPGKAAIAKGANKH